MGKGGGGGSSGGSVTVQQPDMSGYLALMREQQAANSGQRLDIQDLLSRGPTASNNLAVSQLNIPELLAAQSAERNKALAQRDATQAAFDAANRPNLVNPYGTENWSFDGNTGQWTRTQALSDAEQALRDQRQRNESALLEKQNYVNAINTDVLNRALDASRSGLNTNNLPAMQSVSYAPKDFSADRQRIESALFDRLQPRLDTEREALNTRLTNQGVPLGSEAWRNAQDDYNRQLNDLRLATVSQSGEEQQRLSQMDLANLAGQISAATEQGRQRNQLFGERQTVHNMPFAELAYFNPGSAPQQSQLSFSPVQQLQQVSSLAPMDVVSPYMSVAAAQDAANQAELNRNAQLALSQMQTDAQRAAGITSGLNSAYQNQINAGTQLAATQAQSAAQQRSGKFGGLGSIVGTLGGAALMGPVGRALFESAAPAVGGAAGSSVLDPTSIGPMFPLPLPR